MNVKAKADIVTTLVHIKQHVKTGYKGGNYEDRSLNQKNKAKHYENERLVCQAHVKIKTGLRKSISEVLSTTSIIYSKTYLTIKIG